MATFQFRLQRVLEWRQTQRRLEENRLAACHSELHRAEQRIVELETERLNVQRTVIGAGTITAADLAALGPYCLQTKRKHLELNEQRTRSERAVHDQTAVVQAANQKLRLVEKLHERRLAEYLCAEDRLLENLASESYLCRWATIEGHRNSTIAKSKHRS